jgi:hypothetical protein
VQGVKQSLRVCLGLVLCLPCSLHAQRRSGQQNLESMESAGTTHAFVGRPVSVAQLKQIVALDARKRDSAAARQFFRLRLTERLSGANLALLKAALPGVRAKNALVALADASVFLDPPAAEISHAPRPDSTEERRIRSLMVNYLSTAVPKLPNFYAKRTTAHYDDTAEDPNVQLAPGESEDPLHWAGVSSATVVYNDGKEVADPGPLKHKQANPEEVGLVTVGTFGPIQATVIGDGARSEIVFSRWEQGADGPVAVFRVAVPKDKSHYQVVYRRPAQAQVMEQPVAYHGEVSVDPSTGTILRVILEADFEPGVEAMRADVMVEYGPVDIGGKRYICPLRSVSLFQWHGKIEPRNVFAPASRLDTEITRLNDVTFDSYHVFRAEVRMLTGDEAAPDAKP